MSNSDRPPPNIDDITGEPLPTVSIVIPCRNEAKYIAGCLESVVKGDYPADLLEILVVDGMSDDGTADIVRDFDGGKHAIRLLANADRITPAALNAGISAARGSVIARIDAHARVAPDYIRQCVRALRQFGADNVGGVMHTVPSGDSAVSRAIAFSLSHPLGVGNSVFRTHRSEACEVDTVFGGCFPKEVFTRVGRYNERLSRGQDMEFNLRVRRAGGRIMFVPQIVSHYFARGSYKAFARHNWVNGVWAVLPFSLSDIIPVRPRHLVPLAFVAGLAALSALCLLMPGAWPLLAAVIAVYGAACLIAATTVGWKHRDLSAALLLPVMFATLHVCYGAGSAAGIIRLLASRRSWNRARTPVIR